MILVLGAEGQLGQELTRQAGLAGAALAGLGRAGCDITDPAAIRAAIAAHRPDVVVNCAAYTAVDKAEAEEALATRINGEAVRNLGLACAQAGVPLVHISTDYVFDGSKAGPYAESDPVQPIGAYGRSKAAGEAALRSVLPQHVILRTAWVYGEFGHNFLKTMLRLARERDELTIVADQQGCPTATPSLARAILAIAPQLAAANRAGGASLWGTYHLTAREATTWHGFCEEIIAAQAPFTRRLPAVKAIRTADFPTPARRPANSVLDSTRVFQTFGVQCRPWREETREIVAALLAGESRS